ncbi:MAG: hypothetical protein K8S18_22430 [Desulfobacula sp.]|nr:hypothetical protein [Desulfobacula sp.]
MNRGGSWNNKSRNVRCANRNRNRPSNTNNNLGFRLINTGEMQNFCSLRWQKQSAPCPDYKISMGISPKQSRAKEGRIKICALLLNIKRNAVFLFLKINVWF